MRAPAVLALLSLAALAACTSVADLGRPSRPLLGDEPVLVRNKSDEALKQERWADAWNLEKEAGADRARLEEIALVTLEHEHSDAADMFQRLREKFGGISEGAKQRVADLTQKAIAGREWKRAAEIQILAADDPPTYKGAWDVYVQTPVSENLAILMRIQKARDKWDEAQAKKGK